MPGRFSKLHVPTARVSIESIVRMLIEEVEAQPLVADWDDRLTRLEAEFQRSRTR